MLWFFVGFISSPILLCGCLVWIYFRLKRDLEQQGLVIRDGLLWRSLQQIASTASANTASTNIASTNTASVTISSQPTSGDRHQQNYLLKPEHDDWQQILQNAPIGYLEVDGENHLCWINVKARNLLGVAIRSDYIITKRLLLQIVRSYELDLLIAQTRATQQAQQNKWVFHQVVPDPLHPVQQQERMLRGHSVHLLNEHIGIFLEDCQEAAVLQQQRDRWASDVAHELKTPLTSVRLIVETLSSRVAPELREWMERLLQEVIRLGNLVEDLLDLGQMDTGMSIRLHLKSIDLPTLVQSAWANLEPLAARRQVRLEYCGPDSLSIEADESRIYRLLLNLFDNSIKYSPLSQAVVVKLGIECDSIGNQKAIIEVIDYGTGFPETALPYVFDRFYRFDTSRARPDPDASSGGSGLGLAIARQIVQAHKGNITANNHPDTGGAWVRVNLPIC
jgi:two-component system, OmpR family, phosphate regulon sensor histidine kinase PhoR